MRSFVSVRAALNSLVVALTLSTVGCTAVGRRLVRFDSPVSRVEAYSIFEITARVWHPPLSNCFTEATLRGVFESADGARRWEIGGFCDSDEGAILRVRFMPPTPGFYRYTVEYRQGLLRQQAQGTFEAADGHRRGPLRVDPANRWHFMWEGTREHCFLNGTTAYWLAGWADDGVIASSIERFHRLKVNRIRVTLAGRTNTFYGEPVMPGKSWTPLITAWPATAPRDIYHPGFTYSRFDVGYWRKFEHVLQLARDKDIIISVVLDMNDSVVHPRAGSEDERRFIRYAVARFAAFSNVTWDLGDDLEWYRSDEWTRQTGMMVKALDPYDHLATSHPADNAHQDRTSDWFDFTSFQEWSRDQHAFMLAERMKQTALGRIIPQLNEEYGYEDHYPVWAPKPPAESADVLRRTAWAITMAGGYQTTGETARRGTNIWPDTGGGWLNGRGDQTMTMLEGYAHMVDFFTGFDWWRAQPHDELVSAGAFCLARPGQIYVVYFPNGGMAAIQLAAGRFAGYWFEAATGRRVTQAQVDGGRQVSLTAPGNGDWALLLQRAETTDTSTH